MNEIESFHTSATPSYEDNFAIEIKVANRTVRHDVLELGEGVYGLELGEYEPGTVAWNSRL
jgi:hypothetical protein